MVYRDICQKETLFIPVYRYQRPISDYIKAKQLSPPWNNWSVHLWIQRVMVGSIQALYILLKLFIVHITAIHPVYQNISITIIHSL